jgi:hypothetical protein
MVNYLHHASLTGQERSFPVFLESLIEGGILHARSQAEQMRKPNKYLFTSKA